MYLTKFSSRLSSSGEIEGNTWKKSFFRPKVKSTIHLIIWKISKSQQWAEFLIYYVESALLRRKQAATEENLWINTEARDNCVKTLKFHFFSVFVFFFPFYCVISILIHSVHFSSVLLICVYFRNSSGSFFVFCVFWDSLLLWGTKYNLPSLSHPKIHDTAAQYPSYSDGISLRVRHLFTSLRFSGKKFKWEYKKWIFRDIFTPVEKIKKKWTIEWTAM